MRTSLIAQTVALALIMLAGRASGEDPFRFVTSGELIVAKATDANEFLAYSKHGAAWKRHKFPDGVRATPVIDGSICVFAQEGEGITELVGVDRLGNWRIVKLPAPATECKPAISNNVAAVNHDGRTYAFSSITGTWDSTPIVAPHFLEQDMVLMRSEDSIAIFNAQTGTWAQASLKTKAE